MKSLCGLVGDFSPVFLTRGVGHPCVTHPSATPSASENTESVRLACVRHAASVYPEPGSNSPSVVYVSTVAGGCMLRFVSRDPGQAVTYTLGCSQNRALVLSRTKASELTETVVLQTRSRLLSCCSAFHSSIVKVLLEASLARFLSRLLETDIRFQEQLYFKKR